MKALAPKLIAASEETIPAAEQAISGVITGAGGQPPTESSLPQVSLPGRTQSITAASEQLFVQLAATGLFFVKGGRICQIESDENQRLDLKPLSAEQFASEIERYVKLVKETDGVLVPAVITARQVKTMMASSKAREILPLVHKVVHRPILSIACGKVVPLHLGYHPDHGRVLVLSDEPLNLIDPADAVANILDVIKGFPFASEADRGRAVALILTIAMVEMGFLEGVLRPMVMVIANASQSGKSLLVHVACITNELMPLLLSKKGKGGVGSLDESLGHGFAAGGVLLLDNLRGKFDSEFLEAAITARSATMVRQPYAATVSVKLDEVTVTGTSNGVHLTPDQINRILFVHLQKETERPAGSETEVELITRIKATLPTLRNSIASLIASWWEQGRQSIHAPNSYRVEWSGYLNWMVQKQFGLPPLMENHGQIAAFLRNGDRQQILDICVFIDIARRTGEALRAKEVVEIIHDFVEEDAALLHMDHKKFGLLMRTLLRGSNILELDGWKITRTTKHDEPGIWIPNPMTALKGINKEGEPSSRCLDNTGPRKYMVIEFDFKREKFVGWEAFFSFLEEHNLTVTDMNAILHLHLQQLWPLGMVVFSGNESLHGWYPVGDTDEDSQNKFMRYAESLGADKSVFTRCQAVRIPGGVRSANGALQRIIYFNSNLF